MPKADAHRWELKARFRRGAFGWRSTPAITRVRQALAEIRKVARKEPVLAAEGAIAFIERLSPALERVDSSSGAIGTAVSNALAALVPLIADAPLETTTRDAWLERLFEAHQDDKVPYIEQPADHWGDLCASKELASAWADRLIDTTRMALSPDRAVRGHFHGTSACLSALHRAGRYDELIDILDGCKLFAYKQWAARALAARGQTAEALACAAACRGRLTSDEEVDPVCGEILPSYGVHTSQRDTCLATPCAAAGRHPHKAPAEILRDLIGTTPGEEGRWLAAARDIGLHDEALALATLSPCDPRTLARAARDYAAKQPGLRARAGLLALHWLVHGAGHEITSADVWDAYRATLAAAERLGRSAEVKGQIRGLVTAEGAAARFVREILGRELDQ